MDQEICFITNQIQEDDLVFSIPDWLANSGSKPTQVTNILVKRSKLTDRQAVAETLPKPWILESSLNDTCLHINSKAMEEITEIINLYKIWNIECF